MASQHAGLADFPGDCRPLGVTEEQRRLGLGYPTRSTDQNWCRQARAHGTITLDVDVLTRISAVLGIHQALGILFPDEHAGVAWLRGPHKALVFGGQAPIELVTSGSQDALLTVRRFLDGARGGLYMPPNAIDEDFPLWEEAEIVFRWSECRRVPSAQHHGYPADPSL